MSNRKIVIEIETVRAGQPRRYADSEYEYILTVEGMSEFEVKRYCTSVLQPKNFPYGEWCKNKENAATYFAGYYMFENLGNGKYKYYVKEPFCD